MNGRERILATVARGGPYAGDRVAIGNMGFESGILAKLQRRLGLKGEAQIHEALGIDLVCLKPPYAGPPFSYKPDAQKMYFFGSSHKSYSDSVAERPLRTAESVQDVEAFPWPTVDDYDFSHMIDTAERYSGLAIASPGWTPSFSQICELFGMETALLNLHDRPELIEAAVERITHLVCGLATRMHETIGDRLLILQTADDVATQRGLFFSRDTWRKLFRGGMARQFAVGRKLGLINMLHACGAVREIIPDLIEIGLDILEPTQVHLPGMDARELKSEFGKHLTFLGAICTQKTLPFGTPETVRHEVRERVRVLGDGGGYICSPDHAVLDDVPPENVLALYDEAGRL